MFPLRLPTTHDDYPMPGHCLDMLWSLATQNNFSDVIYEAKLDPNSPRNAYLITFLDTPRYSDDDDDDEDFADFAEDDD